MGGRSSSENEITLIMWESTVCTEIYLQICHFAHEEDNEDKL